MIPFLLLSLYILSDNNKFEIIDYSSATAQGHVLSVKLKTNMTSGDDRVSLEFLGRTVPCYTTGEPVEDKMDWQCLAAVPANAGTGEQEVKILINGESNYTIKTEILPYDFPTYPLRLSKSKKDLYKKKGRAKEVKVIRGTLRTESDLKHWSGDFLRPVKGELESDYGERRKIDGKLKKGYHRGVDWGVPKGTPVLSTHHGTVILTGHYIQEGNMVMVDHGQGVISAYLHLSKILVKKGQKVSKGEPVGEVGSTGVSTSYHLHFGVYIHSIPIDPVYWLEIH